MRADRQIALRLRLKGRSYSEIHKILSVPKSTLSGWFSNLDISPEARARIEQRARKKSSAGLMRRNKKQTVLARQRAEVVRRGAASVVRDLDKNSLFVSGVMLYWAEGYKRPIVRNGKAVTHHPVSLTNSDPDLVKLFLKFLREYCGVKEEKIKADIRIFQHQNEYVLKKFWQKETGIPMKNFRKTYYGVSKSSMGKRPFNQLPYGVIQIRIADTALFHKIMGYIEGFKNLV